MYRLPWVAVATLALLARGVAGQGVPITDIEQAVFVDPDPTRPSSFGTAVAVSGDTAVVGDYREKNASGIETGAAYVFFRNDSAWVVQAKLEPSTPAPDSGFGLSVAIESDTIVVGRLGRAYVFTRAGTLWTETQQLFPFGGSDSSFGYSVALRGDTLVVGAAGASGPGEAYVFIRQGQSWILQARLTPSVPSGVHGFGSAVAISGNTVVVGAHSTDLGAGLFQGAAFVFARTGTSWSQQAKLTGSDAGPLSNFGVGVAVSGDTAIIGAPGQAGAAGSAYVFTRTNATWTQETQLASSDIAPVDRFGGAVSFDGTRAVISAYRADLGSLADAGAAYVFAREGGLWAQKTKLAPSDAATDLLFGVSVALDDDTVVVGRGETNDPTPSTAYAFALEPIGSWLDLGQALGGANGLPQLEASGFLTAGTATEFSLASAKPLSVAPLVVGLSNLSAPFKGGTMVPSPALLFPLLTDASGAAAFAGPWPPGIPSGFTTYFQWWIQDPAGPKGFAASNALAGTTP